MGSNNQHRRRRRRDKKSGAVAGLWGGEHLIGVKVGSLVSSSHLQTFGLEHPETGSGGWVDKKKSEHGRQTCSNMATSSEVRISTSSHRYHLVFTHARGSCERDSDKRRMPRDGQDSMIVLLIPLFVYIGILGCLPSACVRKTSERGRNLTSIHPADTIQIWTPRSPRPRCPMTMKLNNRLILQASLQGIVKNRDSRQPKRIVG